MIHLRPSDRDDVSKLFDLWHRAVLASHDFLDPKDFATIVAMVERDYFPATPFVVAVQDNRPIGFIEATGHEIGALFVDPDHQGRGVGRALIAAAMPADAPWRVEVNEANALARSFYEALGFAVTGRRETDDLGLPYPLLRMERPAGPL